MISSTHLHTTSFRCIRGRGSASIASKGGDPSAKAQVFTRSPPPGTLLSPSSGARGIGPVHVLSFGTMLPPPNLARKSWEHVAAVCGSGGRVSLSSKACAGVGTSRLRADVIRSESAAHYDHSLPGLWRCFPNGSRGAKLASQTRGARHNIGDYNGDSTYTSAAMATMQGAINTYRYRSLGWIMLHLKLRGSDGCGSRWCVLDRRAPTRAGRAGGGAGCRSC